MPRLGLTRRVSERVFLLLPDGTEVILSVISIEPNRVRLGFVAPAEVKIFREELLPVRTTDTHEPPGVES